MRIWMLKPDVARYDSFLLPKEFDPEYIRAFDGRTQMSNWKPVRVQRSYHDENLELQRQSGIFIKAINWIRCGVSTGRILRREVLGYQYPYCHKCGGSLKIGLQNIQRWKKNNGLYEVCFFSRGGCKCSCV